MNILFKATAALVLVFSASSVRAEFNLYGSYQEEYDQCRISNRPEEPSNLDAFCRIKANMRPTSLGSLSSLIESSDHDMKLAAMERARELLQWLYDNASRGNRADKDKNTFEVSELDADDFGSAADYASAKCQQTPTANCKNDATVEWIVSMDDYNRWQIANGEDVRPPQAASQPPSVQQVASSKGTFDYDKCLQTAFKEVCDAELVIRRPLYDKTIQEDYEDCMSIERFGKTADDEGHEECTIFANMRPSTEKELGEIQRNSPNDIAHWSAASSRRFYLRDRMKERDEAQEILRLAKEQPEILAARHKGAQTQCNNAKTDYETKKAEYLETGALVWAQKWGVKERIYGKDAEAALQLLEYIAQQSCMN
nr:hypothetical protein [uncultured Cohaesibacter sp.]